MAVLHFITNDENPRQIVAALRRGWRRAVTWQSRTLLRMVQTRRRSPRSRTRTGRQSRARNVPSANRSPLWN